MTARTLRLALSALIALALVSSAWAQEQDAFLQRYELAMEHLRSAVEAMPADPISAGNSVDRAFASLLTLSRDAAGSNLVVGMQRVFERARTSITNGSRDDLAVQAAVLEGGFQRLVYDAALRSALAGDLPLARLRLAQVAADVGFAAPDAAALVDPSQPIATLRFLVETGVSEVIRTRLAVAAASPRPIPAAPTAPSPVRTVTSCWCRTRPAPSPPSTAPSSMRRPPGERRTGWRRRGHRHRRRRDRRHGCGRARTARQRARRGQRVGRATGGPSRRRRAAPLDADEAATTLAAEADPFALVDVTAFLMELRETERRASGSTPSRPSWPRPRWRSRSAPPTPRACSTPASRRSRQRWDRWPPRATEPSPPSTWATTHVRAPPWPRWARVTGSWLSPIVRSRDASLDASTVGLIDHLSAAASLRLQDVVVLAGQVEGIGAAIAERRPLDGAAARRARDDGGLGGTRARPGVPGHRPAGPDPAVPAQPGVRRRQPALADDRRRAVPPVGTRALRGRGGPGGVLARYAGFDALLVLAPYSVLGNAQAQTVWAAMTLLAVVFAIAGSPASAASSACSAGAARPPPRAGPRRVAGASPRPPPRRWTGTTRVEAGLRGSGP
jgi:hypothetical protein